jgi:hypothetical protein
MVGLQFRFQLFRRGEAGFQVVGQQLVGGYAELSQGALTSRPLGYVLKHLRRCDAKPVPSSSRNLRM